MSNITETLTDTLSLSDSLTVNYGILVSDTLTLSDRLTNTYGYLFQEGISLSDGEQIALGVNRTAADQIGLMDFINVSTFRQTINLFDSLTLRDSVVTFAPYVLAVSDTLVLSDSVGFNTINPVDTLNLTDSVSIGIGVLAIDSLTLTDAATATFTNVSLAVQVNVTDTVSLFDSIQHNQFPINILLGDSLSLSDSVGAHFGSNPIPYLRRYLNDVISN